MHQYLLSILLVSMFILCLGWLLGCILLYLIAFKYNGQLITFNLCLIWTHMERDPLSNLF